MILNTYSLSSARLFVRIECPLLTHLCTTNTSCFSLHTFFCPWPTGFQLKGKESWIKSNEATINVAVEKTWTKKIWERQGKSTGICRRGKPTAAASSALELVNGGKKGCCGEEKSTTTKAYDSFKAGVASMGTWITGKAGSLHEYVKSTWRSLPPTQKLIAGFVTFLVLLVIIGVIIHIIGVACGGAYAICGWCGNTGILCPHMHPFYHSFYLTLLGGPGRWWRRFSTLRWCWGFNFFCGI